MCLAARTQCLIPFPRSRALSSRFPNEDTEAWRGWVICPRSSQAASVKGRNGSWGSLAPRIAVSKQSPMIPGLATPTVLWDPLLFSQLCLAPSCRPTGQRSVRPPAACEHNLTVWKAQPPPRPAGGIPNLPPRLWQN